MVRRVKVFKLHTTYPQIKQIWIIIILGLFSQILPLATHTIQLETLIILFSKHKCYHSVLSKRILNIQKQSKEKSLKKKLLNLMFSKFQENWGWEYLQFRISTRNVHYYLKDDFSQPEKKFFPNYNYKIVIIVLGFSTKKACQRNLNSPFFPPQQRHLVNSARDTEHHGKR